MTGGVASNQKRARTEGDIMIKPLSTQVAIVNAITVTAGASGTSAINGTALNLATYGADRVMVVVKMGPITGGAVTSMKVQCDDNASFTNNTDIAGSSQTIADNKDDTYFVSDIINPPNDYIRVVVSRGTQAATCTADYYVYGTRTHVTQAAAQVSGIEVHRDKATGTA